MPALSADVAACDAAVAATDAAQPAQPATDADSMDPTTMDLEALGERIATLAAHVHAATYRLLVLIRAFDEREGWASPGFRSCAHWLAWRTGISAGPAREKVRVARALGSLPQLSAAMARGEISFSKARALTRIAEPETEEDLLHVAQHAPASHLERLVRGWQQVDRLREAEKEAERHCQRRVELWPDESGSWVLRGRLDPEVGAVLRQALEWASEALYRRASRGGAEKAAAVDAAATAASGIPEGVEADDLGERPTAEQRWADALGLVAERAMAMAAYEDEAVSVAAGGEGEGDVLGGQGQVCAWYCPRQVAMEDA